MSIQDLQLEILVIIFNDLLMKDILVVSEVSKNLENYFP